MSFEMHNTRVIEVPHLGGITVGYQIPRPYDPLKPTLVLINSFATTSDLYQAQFENKEIAENINLVAIEPLGHGQTRAKSESFTYWDTAIMNMQVLDGLGIDKAFVLGTSQGGWITVRMALIAPHRIQGIMPLGTSMDFETKQHRSKKWMEGTPDPIDIVDNLLLRWSLPAGEETPNFELDDVFCSFLLVMGFGPTGFEQIREFWTTEMKTTYQGDSDRKRLRMATINLRDRDGLRGRLSDVKCPVMWLQGTSDVVYSVENAQDEIKMFTNSKKAELIPVEGGTHFLSASNPTEVNEAILKLVLQH